MPAASPSRHTDSSPLCSASNCSSCNPAPKQLLHQPCLELKENSRGSSSGKPVPHFGQARLVENTAAVPAALPDFDASCTCTTPLPCSSAVSSSDRSSASAEAPTLASPTGNSMLCSMKRSSRGHF